MAKTCPRRIPEAQIGQLARYSAPNSEPALPKLVHTGFLRRKSASSRDAQSQTATLSGKLPKEMPKSASGIHEAQIGQLARHSEPNWKQSPEAEIAQLARHSSPNATALADSLPHRILTLESPNSRDTHRRTLPHWRTVCRTGS
jgi:hypothetical protein